MESHQLILFLSACAILAATPGPGMLYVLSRTLAGGKREGISSSLGTFIGGGVHVVAAAAGLSIILATSALAFSVVKFAGATYLIYLGIRMLLTAKAGSDPEVLSTQNRKGSPFLQGVVTEVLNPKTALFFLSFIPQFVPRHSTHAFGGFLVLGLISVAMNTGGDLIVVALASPLRRLFTRSPRTQVLQRRASGTVMVALGAYVAATDSR
jgi:threonine/homoserine/homoserine lactone efflux protein